MTYSTDFRQLALAKLAQGLSIRQVAKEALLRDVEQYPDAYCYERAQRLNCSTNGIHQALKRYGISR
ncbi:transposase, partial [Neisseria yangbaofengii]